MMLQTKPFIHPTAIVDPSVICGDGVSIGPYVMVGPNVELGNDVRLEAHCVIIKNTRLGRGCVVSPHAVIGGDPQDVSFGDQETWLEIGEKTVIREFATVHRATRTDQPTRIGNGCMLMNYSHVGHDCQLGDGIILVNNVQLGGHVRLDDYVVIGGSSLVHQHVRIGTMSMMGGVCGARQDIPPYSRYEGRIGAFLGLNIVGLRRRKVPAESRNHLKRAYKLLGFSALPRDEAIAQIRAEMGEDPYVQQLIQFVLESKRGINYRRKVRDTDDPIDDPFVDDLIPEAP